MDLTSRTARVFAGLCAAIALLATSCGSSESSESAATTVAVEVTEAPQSTAETTTQAPPTTVVEAAEEPAVVDEQDHQAALEQAVTDALLAWQQENGAPAVSLSVRVPGYDEISVANGLTDLTETETVTTDSYFRIGSITKSMTSALVLQLVDEGLVELDAPVQQYLPGWLDGHQYAADITIRQLMNHTNGLVEYALDAGFYAEAGQRLDQAWEPEEIIAWLAKQEPLFAPGEQYSYETGGFLTLGRVIEAVTGNAAIDEMRSRIWEPAGAVDIYLPMDTSPPEQVVNGYGRDLMYLAGTLIIGNTDTEGLMINEEPVIDFANLPQAGTRSAGWTGGGIEAQLDDVSAVLKAMFDGTILNDSQIADMTAPTLDSNYGLGISADNIDGTTVYSHGGGVPGFRSQAGYLPDHDVSYAVSASLIPLPEGAGVGELQETLVKIFNDALSE